jgi:hypothetical protein
LLRPSIFLVDLLTSTDRLAGKARLHADLHGASEDHYSKDVDLRRLILCRSLVLDKLVHGQRFSSKQLAIPAGDFSNARFVKST